MKPTLTIPYAFLPRHVRHRTRAALLWLMRQGGETRQAAHRRWREIRTQ